MQSRFTFRGWLKLTLALAVALSVGLPVRSQTDPVDAVASIEFVAIPAGEFCMGADPDSTTASAHERPRRRVRLTQPFQLSKREVTFEQFQQFVQETRYRTVAEQDGRGGLVWDAASRKVVQKPGLYWRRPGVEQSPRDPVVQVAWRDAMMFCGWLSSKLGYECRLPTEAEWEAACQWSKRNGQLVDMQGGPVEWCLDLYGPYSADEVVDPEGPQLGTHRVFRGASVLSPEASCSTRFHKPAGYRSSFLGFRVAQTTRRFAPPLPPTGVVSGSGAIRRRNQSDLLSPSDYYSPNLTTQRRFELHHWRNRESPFHRFWNPPRDRFLPLEIRRRELGNKTEPN